MFPSILIVDDEPSILKTLSGLLLDEGFEVSCASNGYEALKMLNTESHDLVLLDIWMPGISGIETLKEIKKESPHVQVIIISGHGNIETAVQATKLGAFDLIEKPLSIDKVIVAINNALNFRRLEEENKYLRTKTLEKHTICGRSAPVLELQKHIEIAAPSDSWVLITGENGTGKELVARTIHQLSPRAAEPLIDINCAAIPDELIENELFGREKGAVSSVNAKKTGKLELANNGTLFFDEIGDMTLRTQAQILRVLEEKKFQRVGGGRTLNMNARIIAATNKDLEKEIEKGLFRKELYYRLNVIPIHVPPLRERIGDIPLLVETFLGESDKHGRNMKKKLTGEALKLLQDYPWPGNVRELKNLIERIDIMNEDQEIGGENIPPPYNAASLSEIKSELAELHGKVDLKKAKTAFERDFIHRKLMENNNSVRKAAKMIGVSRSYLYKKLKKLEIEI